MPIDESQLVSPFSSGEAGDPQAQTDNLISPFYIKEVAAKMKEADPRIGPLEEIEGAISLGSSFLGSAVGGFSGLIKQVAEQNNLLDSEMFDYKHKWDPEYSPEKIIEGVMIKK